MEHPSVILLPVSLPPDPPRIPPSPIMLDAADPPIPVPAEATLLPATPPTAPAAAIPPKRRRRYRPPMHINKMYTVLRGNGGQGMRVTLGIPDDEEQCPLTISPISEDELDFLPGVRFVLPLPEYTRMTLSCGHAFGAMSLLYHFARRDMRCPCCRHGFKDKLDVDCAPRHFRARFAARIRQAEREDRDELNASDEQVARALNAAVPLPSIAEVLGATPLSLSVYLHSSAAPDGPVTSMEFNLVSTASPDAESEFDLVRPHPNAMPRGTAVSFFLPIQGQRVLNEQLRDGSVTSISLVVHTRQFFPEVNVSELARVGPFPVRECAYDVTRVFPAGNGTYFDVSTRHNPFHLQCLVWRSSPRVPFDPMRVQHLLFVLA